MKTQDFEQFFANATTEQDWYDEKEKADVQKYQALVKLLQENLIDLQVYRAGEVQDSRIIVVSVKSENSRSP